MKQRHFFGLIPILAVFVLVTPGMVADEPPVVGIGLKASPTAQEIAPLAPLKVELKEGRAGDTWRPLDGVSPQPGEVWSIGPEPGSSALWLRGPGGIAWRGAGALRFAASGSFSVPAALRLNGSDYPGVLEIRPATGANGLILINWVSIEAYLPGALLGEIYPAWPGETLKAQAVVCRSNALLWRGRHSSKGYDLCDDVHCQAFRGTADDARIIEAVRATRGQVLQRSGKAVFAYFHASSGGRTENNEDVWPGPDGRPATAESYLRAVDDFDQESPYFRWAAPKCYTLEAFCRLLKVAGEGPLDLAAVLGSNGVAVKYRFARSGAQPLTLTREEIRNRLELPSPRMSFYTLSADSVAEALRAVRLDGPVVLGGVSRAGEGYSLDLRLKLKIPASSAEPQLRVSAGMFVIVDGRGFGHGIGMSQWGAKALGEQGAVYTDILKHYYQGTDVGNAY